MQGRGLFLTFRGVPPHLKQPPLIPTDTPTYTSPQALAYYLARAPQYQVLIGSNFLDVLASIRRFDDMTVCFDDLFVLMSGDKCGKLSFVRTQFDAYIKEVAQKRHRVFITTHRFKRELSTFVQENARLYYVGPCYRMDTLRDLVAVSNLNCVEGDIVTALCTNPPHHPFLVKS